jgi:pyruvate kinase
MQVTLTTDESVRQQQTSSHIWISYRKLYDTVPLGSSILLDDGIVELKVESKGSNGTEVTCRVMNTGVVGNKKGVNMPGLPVELPAMSDKDKLDIRWGIQNNIDYIAASFVRKASDVTEIRDYCRELIRELYPEGDRSPPVPIPSIISKIESVEALINFESILQTSDAIMVARGDLAVEIPMETLANVQKEMVRRCNAAGKPVIVATQMLESMQKNPRPTRAECTDVANAVIDGADCVMLSGESAKGETKRKRD